LTVLLAPFCPFVAESVWQRLGRQTSVHLEAWPEAETRYIDEGLSREVAAARTVITAGLAIRSREKIRVRQPLPGARVALSSSVDLSRQTGAIMQELNVKSLEIVADASAIADRVAKAQARKLGPKYGGAVQDIIKALKDGRFTENADGTVSVGSATLLRDEIEISFVGKPGLSVESSDGVVVAVATEITPELELEGDARDLVRAIQDMRKDAGFELSDRIVLGIRGGDDIVAAYGGYVGGETLATSIVAEAPEARASKSVEIGKRSIRISIGLDG
jgi:isoleucyl-tRNA synthetase